MIVCLNEGKQFEEKQKGEPFNCTKLSSSQETTIRKNTKCILSRNDKMLAKNFKFL